MVVSQKASAPSRRSRLPQLRPARALLYLTLLLAGAVFIYPIIWLVSASLKANFEIYREPLKLIPAEVQLDTYQRVFGSTPVVSYLVNSLTYATGGALLTILLSVLCAYGLSRYSFRHKRTLLIVLLAVQLVPGLVRIIPVFVMMSTLGLSDSQLGLVLLYGATGIAYGTWFLKGFVDAVPKELDEAAWIDGASRLRTLGQILMPLLLPGLVTLFILQFIGHWNDYTTASVLLRNPDYLPLTVGTFQLIGPDESDFRLLASAALINIVPVVVMFSIAQRFLISGAAAGAVKS
jgi:ABC-type glycerol-3-phosphate transport system permease component